MKWLIKIVFSLSILLLFGNDFASVYPLKWVDPSTPPNISQNAVTAKGSLFNSKADARLKPLNKGKYFKRLLAAEFEDDNNEFGAHEKQINKASSFTVFFYAQSYNHLLCAVKSNLPHGKFPAILAFNKLYLTIQVFRI